MERFGVLTSTPGVFPSVAGLLRPPSPRAPAGTALKGVELSALDVEPARSAGAPSLRLVPAVGAGVQTFACWAITGVASKLAAMIEARMLHSPWIVRNAGRRPEVACLVQGQGAERAMPRL